MSSVTTRGPGDTGANLGFLRRHSRLALGVAIAVVTTVGLGAGGYADWKTAFIVGFDLGAFATLIGLYVAFHNASLEVMKRYAIAQDAGQLFVLAFVLLASIAALTAVAADIPHVSRDLTLENGTHAALVVATIVVSWVFIQTIYALHYAHDYFIDVDLPAQGTPAKPSSRLKFPGGGIPTYSDFLYFSFTIGMTFQTSDVQIADAKIRRRVLLHGVMAFFFTTGILALAINLVAGLAGSK
jgi:uncharacterized membrane protein